MLPTKLINSKTHRLKTLGTFVCLLLIALLALGFTWPWGKKNIEKPSFRETDQSIIKIGAIAPLTGDAAVYGTWFKNGIDLGVEEINSLGEVNGRKIKIAYADDRADPKEGVAAFNKLINVEKVKVVIGAMASSVTLSIAPLAQKNKIVLFSPASSSPEITNAGDYIFRNWPSDIFEGGVMAEFAYKKLGIKRVTILYINNEYGLGLKKVFKKEFEKIGGKIVQNEVYEQSSTDFRSQLSKIKNKDIDAVYLPAMAKEVGLLLKQAKELGIRTTYLSSVGIEAPITLEIAGSTAEGVIYTYPSFDPKSPVEVVKNFREKYLRKYGEEPEVFAAHAYDAINIIAEAIKIGGYNSDGIKSALYKIKDFPGVTGPTTFDKNGDVIKPIAIKIIKEGEFVYYEYRDK